MREVPLGNELLPMAVEKGNKHYATKVLVQGVVYSGMKKWKETVTLYSGCTGPSS